MRKAGGRFWILTILLDMGLAVAPVAADAVRFADINTTDVTPDSLSADSAVVLGSSVVFGLTATKEDRELLYRSDGTAAGTVLIQNLAPGVSNTIADMVRLGSIALFSAQDPAAGRELWRSDGTAAGTFRLVDIQPGPDSSFPQHLTVIGSTVYFTANDGVHGSELWETDGTTASLVKDIRPGSLSSTPERLLAVGSNLFFAADDGANGLELWKSNGTEAGTVLVKDIQPGAGGSEPFDFAALGSTLLFTAEATVNDGELWKSDGTAAGTVLVKDILPGAVGSFPSSTRTLGSNVLFTADDGTNGTELWKSNGTAAGTVLVKDIVPGTDGISLYDADTGIAALGSVLILSLDDGGGSGAEIWRTDGTAAGTFLLADIQPGPDCSCPSGFTVVGANVLFDASDVTHGTELWKTDGTVAGTVLVEDIFPGDSGSRPHLFAQLGSIALLTAGAAENDSELWRSDGTAAGTFALVDPTPSDDTSSSPFGVTDSFGTVVFSADDGVHGSEPWRVNATTGVAALMLDIAPGASSSSPSEFTTANGRTFFAASGSEGIELWKRTVTSALLVKDIQVGSLPSSPADLIEVGGTLYFSANDGSHGRELWRSDGNDADTTMVVDLSPGTTPGGAQPIRASGVFGNGILFGGAAPATGDELYTTDGTAAHTTLVSDFVSGAASSSPDNFLVSGTVTFLSATTAANGEEPWAVVDAGIGGFVEVALGDLNPGSGGSQPHALTNAGGTIFFVATDPTHGEELWKTGGSAATTVLVKDIFTGLPDAALDDLTSFAGRLFFRACEAATGCELWTSDGTTAGTVLFKDLIPGAGSGNPTHLTVSGDDLWFSACTIANGCELWVSDGTPQRTRLASDIHPGPESSNPSAERARVGDTPFVSSGGRLFFVANDGSGRELWAVSPLLFDDGFESATTGAWSATVP